MSTNPREDERDDGTATGERRAAESSRPSAAVPPALRALDLDGVVTTGMVCDIDDPDCNPMAFAGTDGAPAIPATKSGGADETPSP